MNLEEHTEDWRRARPFGAPLEARGKQGMSGRGLPPRDDGKSAQGIDSQRVALRPWRKRVRKILKTQGDDGSGKRLKSFPRGFSVIPLLPTPRHFVWLS